jgi:MYXO-CTERM domain-containing protein
MPWIWRLALMSWFIVSGSLVATRSARAQSCSVPSQCTQLAPVCNGGLCVPCLTNHGTGLPTDCPTANQPYCWVSDSGSLGGSCTQCGPGAGNSALCDSSHPVCLSDGTCGCTETSQCASGFSCDQSTQSCVLADAGASDAGAGDAGIGDASSSDGSTKEDAASPNDASSGEGDASTDAEATDAAPTDAEATDAEANDAEVADGASLQDGGGSGDGASESDAAASDAEPSGSGEGGGGEATAGDGEYILGGGCACTTGPGGAANGAAAFVALALACSAMRRRRSR